MSVHTSVVIPVHNRAALVQRAVRSALNQTVPPLEVIVVDDGSSDATIEQVEAIADRRVQIIALPKCGGAAAARNAGLAIASGEVVAFLDSDDEWSRFRLERQLTDIPTAGLLASAFVVHYPERAVRAAPGCFRGSDPHRRLLRLQGGPLTTSCLILDRRRAGQMRFDETMPALQDLDFALRVTKEHGFAFVDSPLVRKFSGHGERVFTTGNEVPARRLLMERHMDELRADSVALGAHHVALARSLARTKDVSPTEVRKHLDAAVAAWPGAPTRAVRLAWDRGGLRGLKLACQAWWFLAEDPVGRVLGAARQKGSRS